MFYIFSIVKNWKDKIYINNNLGQDPPLLSKNSFGIFFDTKNDTTVYFKPLNEVFSSSLKTDTKGLVLYFERDFIEEDDEEYALDILNLFKLSSDSILKIKEKDFTAIATVLSLIKEEYKHKENAYLLIKTLLKVLMLKLIRIQNSGYLKQDLNQKRVFLFLKLMESNYIEETSGDYYAQQMGISEKRLNQILKEKLNLTAKQVIQQRQVTEIKRMLKQSSITLKEMAFYFGFESLSSFSRFFKRHAFMSPSEYKEMIES
ncbi:helix-turn-helix domain-containing protein [Cellulophaga baltica]|nr:helix-turn-helix domain-containing protein [Cellulophaga baltica]MDO6766643.1 helix-turn-helix domain-containing protein [Cellulophaga sp. 1_MG-2023]